MKTALIVLKDHHDPIWNKPFEEHLAPPGAPAVRSYSERQALQFDRWFDMLPGTPARYEIEQACTIRKYLDRHPERLPQVRRMVADGQVELLGGGESVIDYNLVMGESIVRNLLHGLRWMERTLGARPRVGAAPDTFGLSAQVPQIFRQFGFRWLPMYSRCFGYDVEGMETEHVYGQPPRPFWRGIDGSLICIKCSFAEQGMPRRREFVNHQYGPCPECRGQGCRFCDYTGLDIPVTHPAASLDPVLADLANGPHDAAQILCDTEETVKHPAFVRDLQAIARRLGASVRFVTHGQLMDEWAKPYLGKLDTGEVGGEQVDLRAEGNPVATGCYTTRSVLKRWNRELEHLLLGAERFCALAAPLGYAYPTEALGDLWRTLSLTQFHDGVTGSHPDGPFAEMMTCLRRIRTGGGKRLLGACRAIAARIDAPQQDDAVPVAVFNPLGWPVRHVPVEVVVPADALAPTLAQGSIADWSVATADGAPLPVLSWKRVTIKDATVYRIECLVDELPPCGYATVLCRPQLSRSATQADAGADSGVTTDDAEAAGLQARQSVQADGRSEADIMSRVEGNTIESDRYRLAWDDRGLTEIVDKSLGRAVAGRGSCELMAEDDIGSLWETLKRFGRRVNLHDVAEVKVDAFEHPSGRVRKLVIRGTLRERLDWDLPEQWTYPLGLSRGKALRELSSEEVEVCIDRLEWSHEMWLVDGSDTIRMRTRLDCDSQNVRLVMPLALGFQTPQDRAIYEIPYGMLERPSYEPKDGVHCCPDGTWPAVHWAAAVNADENYTCAVLNRGAPAHRFSRGVMEVALLRSPRLNVWRGMPHEVNRASNTQAMDAEPHAVELAFTSGPGGIEDNRLVHRGYEFNTFPTAIAVTDPVTEMAGRSAEDAPRPQSLSAQQSFAADPVGNVLITALKQAEDSDRIVMRLAEVYGRSETRVPAAAIGEDLAVASPMEDDPRPAPAELVFGPFEIKTVTCTRPASPSRKES